MSRTQDLVLARLRLVARRWQGDPAAWGTARPARDVAGAESSGPLAADGPFGEGPFEDDGPLEEGSLAHGPLGEGPLAADGPLEDGPFEDDSLAPDPLGGDPFAGDGLAGREWPAPSLWVRLVGTLVIVVLAGGAVLLATSRPRERPPDPMAAQGMSEPEAIFADPFPSASASPAPSVLVHVVGAVRRPGVIRLPAGSRVADAVEQAGGLRRNGKVGGTNLARQVTDGERIEVGAPGRAPGVDQPGSAPDTPQVDLNTATAEQLDALPGVGPVTAAKILAWRSEQGRFTVVDELAEVAGIGPKTLAELRALVRV